MNRRLEIVLERLDENGLVNVNELSKEFKVSSATIRRDLSNLEKKGKLKRIPGGAVKASENSIVAVETDFNMSNKLQMNAAAKKNVCKIACEEIRDGECIYIDGGTSSFYMFHLLQQRPVTIVTNNQLCVSQITSPTIAKIIIVGGVYMSDFALTYGASAIKQIQEYNFDRCFITCVGIDFHKNLSYATETETKELKSIACKKSKHRYLLTDHSKIDVTGFCSLKPLDYFDTIFCDQKQPNIEYPENIQFSML